MLALLRSSLPRWRRTRTLRVSYALTQHMRDVLGGKRKVPGNPEEHVQAILRVLAGGTPAAGAVGEQLAASSRPSWMKTPVGSSAPAQAVFSFSRSFSFFFRLNRSRASSIGRFSMK